MAPVPGGSPLNQTSVCYITFNQCHPFPPFTRLNLSVVRRFFCFQVCGQMSIWDLFGFCAATVCVIKCPREWLPGLRCPSNNTVMGLFVTTARDCSFPSPGGWWHYPVSHIYGDSGSLGFCVNRSVLLDIQLLPSAMLAWFSNVKEWPQNLPLVSNRKSHSWWLSKDNTVPNAAIVEKLHFYVRLNNYRKLVKFSILLRDTR